VQSVPIPLVYGQLVRQMPQALPLLCQYWKHLYESSNHALWPLLFHGPRVVKLGSSSNERAREGQAPAHFLQRLHKFRQSKIGGTVVRHGRSVKTLHKRTAGPNSGVTSFVQPAQLADSRIDGKWNALCRVVDRRNSLVAKTRRNSAKDATTNAD